MVSEWQYTKPSNEKLVEVEDENGTIIRVLAFWGRDGYLPHWRSEDNNIHYHPSAFKKWRNLE